MHFLGKYMIIGYLDPSGGLCKACGRGVGFEVFGGLRVGYELSETCMVRGNLFRDTSTCCAEPGEREA